MEQEFIWRNTNMDETKVLIVRKTVNGQEMATLKSANWFVQTLREGGMHPALANSLSARLGGGLSFTRETLEDSLSNIGLTQAKRARVTRLLFGQ
jgi:hypothetical protein